MAQLAHSEPGNTFSRVQIASWGPGNTGDEVGGRLPQLKITELE